MVFMTRVLFSKLEFTAGGGNFDLQQQERTGRQMRTNVKAAPDPRYCRSQIFQTTGIVNPDIADPRYCKPAKYCKLQILHTPGNEDPKYCRSQILQTPDITRRYPGYGQGDRRWQAFGECKK